MLMRPVKYGATCKCTAETANNSDNRIGVDQGIIDRDFSFRNNFANAGSFAKVFVPVHIYNSLC